MQISLQQVAPIFIEPEKIASSEVWNKNIVFHPGEKIHIIAPSGRGKTSLIHFLYGMRKDYNGVIAYDDKDIRSLDAEGLAGYRQKNISIVFQDLRLFTEQTVQQNLDIKRQLDPFHSESRIIEMARRLGIENKLAKLAKTCSYGEQQRIAIIRSLQQPFDFLLLDEPFSHLDDSNRRIGLELIEEECALRKAAIILADLRLVEHFRADKILNL
jgi:ABC-type lipoprotein export system ATPase subunit